MCDALLEGGLPRKSLPRAVNNETPASERKTLYKRGGCIMVTARILIVDLLTHRLQPTAVAGFLVGNAHRVSPTSQEAFILQMFRDGNRDGFVKAFTDRPASLATGFNRLSKVMKALHLRRVFLWPRFHVAVASSLRGHEPEVIEINQPLTPLMMRVQRSIISAMDACLEELQSSTSLALAELKVESSLSGDFDSRIRRQLDPLWNKLPQATKQVVTDLKTLRQLLDYLLTYASHSDSPAIHRLLLRVFPHPTQLLCVVDLAVQAAHRRDVCECARICAYCVRSAVTTR